MQLSQIETALDAGEMFAVMANGRHWRIRRNGKTQTWEKSPERFRIPVKAGLKVCGEINQDSVIVFGEMNVTRDTDFFIETM
jgi:hypothetical protein